MNLSNAVLQGLRRPAAIMWVGLSRQLVLPPIVFPLLSVVLGFGVSGVFWGIVIVNWSAALITLVHAVRVLKQTAEDRPTAAKAANEEDHKTEAAPVFGCIEPEELETV
jgi:Na+-driven multidrug efflux pump